MTSIDEAAAIRDELQACIDRILGEDLSYGVPVTLMRRAVAALSAIASRQAVVPLIWHGDAADYYKLQVDSKGKVGLWTLHPGGQFGLMQVFDTEDAAKAAAQADYTQRIRSALE